MITACMITKNEEAWIGDCIEHLKPIVDEFIVIDTGSTDRTIEIARKKGARVSKIQWENDFAKARNRSLEKATQRWILIIDPDERIGKKDLEKIKKLTGDKNIMAYSFNSRNYTENPSVSGYIPCKGHYPEEQNYVGYFEGRKVRLFQNIPTVRFVGSVHELVEPTIHGKILESDIPFHHYGSTQEIAKKKEKHAFYQAHSQKKAKENPSSWKAQFELGVEWLSSKQHKKAVTALEKARELKPRDPMVLSNLGFALMEAARLDEAQEVLEECLKNKDNYHDALLNLGVVEMRRSQWAKAIERFSVLLKAHGSSFLGLRNVGNCYAQLKKYREAARCLEQALKIFPAYNEARLDLGIVCFAGGRPDLAKKVLTEALKENPKSVRARAVLDEIEKALKSVSQKK